jgi:hypothetical protein
MQTIVLESLQFCSTNLQHNCISCLSLQKVHTKTDCRLQAMYCQITCCWAVWLLQYWLLLSQHRLVFITLNQYLFCVINLVQMMWNLNLILTMCYFLQAKNWQNYNYYIMITLLPNKVKSMGQIFKFEKKKIVLSWKVFMCHIYGHNVSCMVHVPHVEHHWTTLSVCVLLSQQETVFHE